MTKKEQILQSTIRIIGKEGLHVVTMSNIAKDADIGKSTIYEYFDSKDDLIREATVYFARGFVELIHDKSWEAGSDYETVLKGGIIAVLEVVRPELISDNSFITNMMNFSSSDQTRAMYKEAMKPISELSVSYTEKVIKLGQKEGILRENITKIDVILAQRIMIMLFMTFMGNMMDMNGLEHLTDDEIVEYIYTYVTKTLM